MEKETPLISCICITKSRPSLLQRAIACYDMQDYPNKELVISYQIKDLVTKHIIDQIESLSEISIIRLERDDEETLGVSRNNAVFAANGAFVCFWDDDDWHSSDRISQQFSVLENSPFKASILMNVLMYDEELKQSYYSISRYFQGTLLCEKELLVQTSFPDLNKGEFDSVISYLLSRNALFHILDRPNLYIFMYHGNNALSDAYFNHTLLQSTLLDQDFGQKILNLTDPQKYQLKNLSQ